MEISSTLLVARMFIVLITISIGIVLMALAATIDKRSPVRAKGFHTSWVILLLLILLAACTKTTYYSRIENIDLTAKGEVYEISLQPRFKEYGLDNPSLRGFVLTVMNNSDQDLRVVWKDTRFTLNGEDKSGFVFSDTDPKFRHMPKRPSVVPSGGRLREAIFPAKYASYISVWHHSTLPQGELGIRLTLQVDDETITETLTLFHDTNIK